MEQQVLWAVWGDGGDTNNKTCLLRPPAVGASLLHVGRNQRYFSNLAKAGKQENWMALAVVSFMTSMILINNDSENGSDLLDGGVIGTFALFWLKY